MFVPGNNPRYLAKAASSAADAVLLDLEDGVPPAEKESARGKVADTLAAADFRPRRFVRLNAAATPWFDDDLDTLVRYAPAGFCVPKVDTPDVIREVSARVAKLEAQAGLAAGSVRLVAAIESALALVNAPAIAAADPRLDAIMFGAEDYALTLGLGTMRQREGAELVYARSAMVNAAASADIDSVDGVFPDLDDPDGTLADIQRSRDLGFTGKSTFNPRQLDDINRIFSPQPDEIGYAERVVAAFDEAQARGDGSVAVGGQLVDRPIVLRAQRTLEIHATLREA
jgi:citrate lyase subunit beta/citryl-CoA lyase